MLRDCIEALLDGYTSFLIGVCWVVLIMVALLLLIATVVH